jgi:secondary thiamine-phosphate synthase enzyme
MATEPLVRPEPAEFRTLSATHRLKSSRRVEFRDVTPLVEDLVHRSGVLHGTVSITTRHTTTAILVNEPEPLLLEDTAAFLEKLAPVDAAWGHNDMSRRHDVPPDEKANADSHLRAMLLGASETLPIVDGRVSLGRWQRVLFLELDGPRRREFTIVALGLGAER